MERKTYGFPSMNLPFPLWCSGSIGARETRASPIIADYPWYTLSMAFWLDLLPSNEREKIRRRLRSPEEYERLREKVKGPEDLEREMDRNERMAEARFALESEPKAKEMLRKQIAEDLKSSPPESVLDRAPASVSKGNFDVIIDVNPQTKEDQVFVIPEGNVQEKIPVQQTFSEQYITQLLSGGQRGT